MGRRRPAPDPPPLAATGADVRPVRVPRPPVTPSGQRQLVRAGYVEMAPTGYGLVASSRATLNPSLDSPSRARLTFHPVIPQLERRTATGGVPERDPSGASGGASCVQRVRRSVVFSAYGVVVSRRIAVVALVMLAACGHSSKKVTTSSSSTTSAASTLTTIPASTTPVSTPETGPTSLLTTVRVAHNGDADRVVFEFQADSGLPGYKVAYTPRPIVEDPNGDTVAVAGDEVVSVRMVHAGGFDLSHGDAGKQTYNGAK